MKKAITILSLLVFVCGGLSAQEKPKKTSKKMNLPVVATNPKEVKYRFIVSFISIGSGIDHKSLEKTDKFITEHAKKPVFDKIQQGREGEMEYCFLLKEFSTSEQKTFIKDLKKVIGSSDLVKYSENQDRVKK